jgi:hypothetical protein
MHSKTTCAFQAEDTIHLPLYADMPVPNCKLAPPWHDGDAVAMKPLIKLEREGERVVTFLFSCTNTGTGLLETILQRRTLQSRHTVF